MSNKIEIDFSQYPIAQLGYVYKDIRKHAAIMETFFGLPKFNIVGPIEMDIVYRGKETKFTATAAFSKLFNNTEIELIQFDGGESIHKEFLDQGKEGLHHIRFDLDNVSEVIEKFKSEGIEILQTGKLINLTYVYMDTEDLLGIIVEFSETKKRRKKR